MPTPQSKDRGIGYFHFLLLKFGYSNKTNNPNDSPSKRMFGLFSCVYGGRKDYLVKVVVEKGILGS